MPNKEEESKQAPFSGKAGEDFIKHIFDTRREKMLEMSILSNKQALAMAVRATIRDGLEFEKQIAEYKAGMREKPEMFWLGERFDYYFLQSARSTHDGFTLTQANKMLETTLAATVEPEDFIEPMESV